MQSEAAAISLSTSLEDSLGIAHALYRSDVYQARMLAVLIFEDRVSQSPVTFTFLRTNVSNDDNWKVQEMLARAFDRYCKDLGYEQTLPTIKDWINDRHPNVRRAVSEGLRVWTHRDYFKKHPEVAIEFLSALRDDEHLYVRKSAGNALRDISRTYSYLVKNELDTWDTSRTDIA